MIKISEKLVFRWFGDAFPWMLLSILRWVNIPFGYYALYVEFHNSHVKRVFWISLLRHLNLLWQFDFMLFEFAWPLWELWFASILSPVAELIQKLINKGKQLDAVKYIQAFNLIDKYPPVPLLKSYLKATRKAVQEIRLKGNYSTQNMVGVLSFVHVLY